MERSRQTASEPPRSESPFPDRSASGERPAQASTARRVEDGPLRAVDWFIPESATLPDDDALRRARLTISVSFVAGCSVLATLVAATDEPDSWTIRLLSYALGLLLVATPLASRAGVPVQWLGHVVVAIMAGYALSLAGATGGRDSGGFFLAMITPLPAVLLLGRRAGTVWAVGLALGMGALATAFQLGAEQIVSPLQSEVARWGFWGCIAGIAGTCGVASIYESLQARTLARLVEAKRLADREHERRLALEAGFRADLERLVEERTRELRESREQLRHADRLASIGTLAAGVAHQINNPVGAILLGSELALSDDARGTGAERYRETLERIRIDAERCGEIVRNLLRFSRRAVTDHDHLDLNEALERAIETLGTSGRQVELVRSREALPLLANAIELEQVILNLVTNAVQAGAETISVSTRRVDGEAQLEVADDGCGIREEDRDRVFDPFFTARPTEGGTGLGLSMAHRIVEDHGGRIGVDSKPGRGTRFFVSLPLRGESSMLDESCEP